MSKLLVKGLKHVLFGDHLSMVRSRVQLSCTIITNNRNPKSFLKISVIGPYMNSFQKTCDVLYAKVDRSAKKIDNVP